MSKKIFLVEDDADYAEFVKVKLQDKYKVDTFSKAEDCLTSLKSIKPDVLIIDYYLPEMNGIDLYEKIKNTLSEDIKVIMLSSMDDVKLLSDIIKKGIRDYVIKDDNVIDSLINSIEEIEDDSLDAFFSD